MQLISDQPFFDNLPVVHAKNRDSFCRHAFARGEHPKEGARVAFLAVSSVRQPSRLPQRDPRSSCASQEKRQARSVSPACCLHALEESQETDGDAPLVAQTARTRSCHVG